MKNILKRGGLIFAGLLLTIIIAGQFSADTRDTAGSQIVMERVLVPGGHSVGVQMDVKGALIVGLEEITTPAGEVVNPGLQAGLQIGDMILAVNGTKVYKAQEVEQLVNKIQDEVRLKIQRKNKVMNVDLTPVINQEDGLYKLGVWIKDKTAGIGTLTYYDPVNMTFGALGHAICDPETGSVLTVNQGELIQAKVQSVKEGKSGEPGEIQGVFYEAESPLGNLNINSELGIFGEVYHPIENSLYSKPLVVGTKDQVEKGTAYILTTLENNEIDRFEIEIEKIYKKDNESNKNMRIKVTDERLLEQSGGIVQGMSGSPIIQNNRIVGAVTHVLVNDPTRGYGIFIEKMLDTSE